MLKVLLQLYGFRFYAITSAKLPKMIRERSSRMLEGNGQVRLSGELDCICKCQDPIGVEGFLIPQPVLSRLNTSVFRITDLDLATDV